MSVGMEVNPEKVWEVVDGWDIALASLSQCHCVLYPTMLDKGLEGADSGDSDSLLSPEGLHHYVTY